jgi:hypothetical protein
MTCSMRNRIPVLAILLIVCWARPARADGYLSAGLGVSFGSPAAEGRANLVGALGWLPPREPIGVEADFTYAPSFFKNPGSFTENRLTTVMGNVVFAGLDRRRGPVRPGLRTALRPYVSGGFGLMSERIATASPASVVSNQHLGINVGLGVIALPRESFGVRLEVRYFQDLVGASNGTNSAINFGSFHFFRASVGAVFSF